jgi:SOS response regulatory protein OraA/RecX
VTALRAGRRGRVAVELDGEPWRMLPLEPVVRAGLVVGAPLDRPRARALARELRRGEALDTAAGALRRRELPARRLEERLARRSVPPAARAQAVATMQRLGLVDDRRFAEARASALAGRGYGDEAIRWDLERQGVDAELAAAAVARLAPERDRAAGIVAARGGGPATARLLARRGFGEDAVEAAAEASGAEGPAAVG